jgi:hypothetical protein
MERAKSQRPEGKGKKAGKESRGGGLGNNSGLLEVGDFCWRHAEQFTKYIVVVLSKQRGRLTPRPRWH